MAKMKRGMSLTELAAKKYDLLPLSPRWHDAFGEPAGTGVWFVWGGSGNGKTTFVCELCKELCRFGKGAYDSLEERDSHTLQQAFVRTGMFSVAKKMILIWDTIEELDERLSRPKSPWFVVIDSVQYVRAKFSALQELFKKYPNKLFIIISQADGKRPKGKLADDVHYDASLKIWIEGFMAFSKGRYIGPVGSYTISEERASLYWSQSKAKSA